MQAGRVLALLPLVAAMAGAQSPMPSAVRREVVEWTDSVTTRAIVWSPINNARSLPTLLFSPGFGQAPGDYSRLLESWASRGYIVVGVTHPEFKDPDHAELYDVSPVVARQLMDVLTHILGEQVRSAGPFARVDPLRVGVVGHSVGGSAAAQACSLDDRFRAGMNLDGTIFGSVVHTGMRQPFFLMRQYVAVSAKDPPRFLEQHDQGNMHEDSVFAHTPVMYWLTVPGLDHMAFTNAALDESTMRQIKEVAGFGTSAKKVQEMTTRYVLDFFGAYLSGALRSPNLETSPYSGTTIRFRR
ncbi:MAG TPA: hypothetical protein VF483_11040 [Gemmatimonadaceae bacterium]